MIKIKRDTDPQSPRDWDNLGLMVCWHRRYKLGDEQPKSPPETYEIPSGAVVLPLYLYDHSGITMSTEPFSCPWDSGQVGYIFATEEKIREAFLTKKDDEINDELRAKVVEELKGEVNIYDCL